MGSPERLASLNLAVRIFFLPEKRNTRSCRVFDARVVHLRSLWNWSLLSAGHGDFDRFDHRANCKASKPLLDQPTVISVEKPSKEKPPSLRWVAFFGEPFALARFIRSFGHQGLPMP